MQMRRLAVFSFFFWWRSNYSKWLRVVFSPHPTQWSVYYLLTPGPFNYPPPHRHRASAAITYRITSRQKVNFPTGHLSKPITAGGQDEVKWHDLWDGWKGRGHKCIANLRDVQIKAQEVRDPKGWCGTEVPLNAPWSDYIIHA